VGCGGSWLVLCVFGGVVVSVVGGVCWFCAWCGVVVLWLCVVFVVVGVWVSCCFLVLWGCVAGVRVVWVLLLRFFA